MQVFVVGRLFPGEAKEWEVVGVYSTEEKAVEACLTGTYFIGPINMDEASPEATTEWPGSYIPDCKA